MLDEGAAWFGNFDKYGGGGDAAFFLSAFSGIGTIVDRVKAGGSVAPDKALLSACVGIQPERLAELLLNNRADDGLVSRFLPAWPDAVPPVWDTRPVSGGLLDLTLRRLRSLSATVSPTGTLEPVILHLAPDARELFGSWWVEAKVRAQSASGLLAGFLGKGLGVTGRLALVLELLNWASVGGDTPPSTVSIESVRAAIRLQDEYFVPMAGRVYGDPKSLPTPNCRQFWGRP